MKLPPFFLNLRMKPKLVLLFIMTGIVPLGIVAIIGSHSATTALQDLAFEQLRTIQSIKRDKLQDTLLEHVRSLKLLAASPQVNQAVREFAAQAPADTQGWITTPQYRALRARHDAQFRQFMNARGLADITLLEAREGIVLYTARDGEEAGTRLNSGNFRNTGLATVWEHVTRTGDMSFDDFRPYEPDHFRQAAFLGYPVHAADGTVSAVLAVRLAPDFVNGILPSRQGLGRTGESYLVRWLDNARRFELRSDLQTLGQGVYVVGYTLDRTPPYWKDALQTGFEGGGGIYEDSTGTTVLVAYNALDILGTTWLLVSKIDRTEVLRPIQGFLLVVSGTGVLLVLLIAPGAFLLARRISRPLEEGVAFAEAISGGDLSARLELLRRDELGVLAQALNRMARNLREIDWLNSGRTGLDDALRGEHLPVELAQRFITFVCKHLDSAVGLFFLYENGMLQLRATHAYTPPSDARHQLHIGEGLVGQAVRENDILIISQRLNDAPAFLLGPEEIPLAHFLAAPVNLDGQLVGAFLLGAQQEFLLQQRQFVRDIIPGTAILFNMATSRGTIAELLHQAQTQQEELQVTNEELEEQARMLLTSQAELQAQQEELQVTNEELAEQTAALRESEHRLREQQDELRAVNDKLGERAQELEEQKIAIRRKNKELLRAQEQLKLKARELELASRYKSEFLANMSHELRTPLNSILILSQLLAQNKENTLSLRQTESAKAIHSSGADLLRLINEILDLAKVEAGRMELQLGSVPFTDVVSDLQRVFKGIAAEKGVGLRVELAPDLPQHLVTDSHRLQQILRNLLSNAFKFTERGEVTLAIFRPGPDTNLDGSDLLADSSVCIAVRDMGIGIPEDKQAAIFEAFRQADGSTNRKYGGTGLGLSISRELARLLGGEIRLHSVVGHGSTFTLLLPDVHAAAQTEPEANVPAPQPPAAASAYVPDDRSHLLPDDMALLIIEDDPDFARVLRDQARLSGFKALVATDGETGLHFADFHAPRAIVLDAVLPGMTGWNVMERLKGDPRTRHIPVYVISAQDMALDAMRKGALGFLTKPVDADALRQAFDHLRDFAGRPVRRLLVVDDDALQRQSIRLLIGNGDVETVTAASGRDALELLASQSFDCMILDLGLADISGFEVLRTIRATPTLSGLPVVVYTGRELSDDEEQQLTRYAESIIVKGVRSPQRLLEETTLFLHRVETRLPQASRSLLGEEPERESALDGRTILIVDDDMRNVFALSNVLEEKGLHIHVARDGGECLEQLRTHPETELVLMDIMMPGMDGYEAIRAIRSDPGLRDLPVIALTAKAMKGDKNRCIDAGANDYLSKPVDMDKLLSLLRVWLYKK